MKRFLGLLLALTCSYAMAVDDPPVKVPEVDTAEVIRRGNDVAVVGEGPRSGEDEAIRAALAPPEDDSHKWFVMLIVSKDCPPCAALKADFRKVPDLLAFVAAPEESRAWAHYLEYQAEDTTQQKRLAHYKVTGYPTLVIQPPRNGMWGPPSTVVFQQSGYDGDPKKLSAKISNVVKKYAAKMHNLGYPKHATNSPVSLEEDLLADGATQAGVDPPFNPFTPLPPQPQYPQYPSQYPPIPQPTPSGPAGDFMTKIAVWMGSIGIVFLTILRVLERIAPVTPTKLDDLAVTILKTARDLGLFGPVQPPNNPINRVP